MNTFDLKLKGLAALQNRLQALLDDKYYIVFDYKDAPITYVRLKHTNGNQVTLIYNAQRAELCQYTNGKLVHSEKVC